VSAIADLCIFTADVLSGNSQFNEVECVEKVFILTLVIAATGLTISEALGLCWGDLEYHRIRIVVRRSWVGEIGGCKNVYRKAPVAMHPGSWRSSSAVAKGDDV